MFKIIESLIPEMNLLLKKKKSTFKGAGRLRADARLDAYRKAQAKRLKNVCPSLNLSSRQVRRRLARNGW